MTNSPENLDNIPNQQGKESVIISPKHTYPVVNFPATAIYN